MRAGARVGGGSACTFSEATTSSPSSDRHSALQTWVNNLQAMVDRSMHHG